jgi:hypothetical protein
MTGTDAVTNMSGLVGAPPVSGGAKRPHGRDDIPITPSMFEGIMAESNKKQLDDTKELIDKSSANHANTMEAFGRQIEAKFAEQTEAINEVKTRVDEVETRQDGFQSELEEVRAAQGRIEASLHLANKTALTRADLDQDLFDRPPDLSVIKITSQKFATKTAIEDSIIPWLTSCGVSRDTWTITGRPSGKRFHIKFLLNPLSAGKLVPECLNGLKDDNGNWKQFEVTLVTGGTCKLFIGKDESPKEGVQRRLAACIKKSLALLYPQIEEVHFRPKAKGIGPAVFSVKVPLASLQPESESPDKKSIGWNPAALAEFGIDRVRVNEQVFKFLDGDAEPIPWLF